MLNQCRNFDVEFSTFYRRFFDHSTPNKKPLKYSTSNQRLNFNDSRNFNVFSTTVEIYLRFSTLFRRQNLDVDSTLNPRRKCPLGCDSNTEQACFHLTHYQKIKSLWKMVKGWKQCLGPIVFLFICAPWLICKMNHDNNLCIIDSTKFNMSVWWQAVLGYNKQAMMLVYMTLWIYIRFLWHYSLYEQNN